MASLVRGAKLARPHGALPMLLVLDLVVAPDADVSRLIATAEQQGYVVFNLLDVYGAHDAADLRVAPWDNHPNALAHELIADRLYHELADSPILATADDPAPALLSLPEPEQSWTPLSRE